MDLSCAWSCTWIIVTTFYFYKNISLIFPGQLLSFKITWFKKKSCKVRVDMTWILNLWTSLTCNCDLIVVHAVTNLNFEYMHNFYSFKIDLIMSLKKEITEMRKISCSKRLFIYLPSVLSMCSFISKLCFS